MTAPAQAAEDLAFCLGCERKFPENRLSGLESHCARCLRDIAAQNSWSRYDLARRMVEGELISLGVTARDRRRVLAVLGKCWP